MADPRRLPLSESLAGTRVLVTGATGSFGNAFVRRALAEGADRVVIFSRDELKQAEMRATVDDDRARFFLGDIRDRDRLRRAMEGIDLVIHAAALKRIEAGEQDAEEFVKTNVLGTLNVVNAAKDAGVGRVVALSTDKACQASTLYGSTKLVAERVARAANNARGARGPRYAAVRYGNVSGSRGSVIPKWRALLAAGQPITVTDPDATRYWMTLDQAVDLVCWTAAHLVGGEVVVPDLPAYRVGDLALAMQSTGDGMVAPNIITTALANGEKRHEAMIAGDEVREFRQHGPYWSTAGTGVALGAALTSDTARRLTVDELRGML